MVWRVHRGARSSLSMGGHLRGQTQHEILRAVPILRLSPLPAHLLHLPRLLSDQKLEIIQHGQLVERFDQA